MAMKRKRVAQKVKNLLGSKSREPMPSIADLSLDIITHILLKLPMKSVLICRCVCKRWRTLISDPNFARSHLTHALASFMIRANRYDPNRVSSTLHLLEYEQERFDSENKQFCCFVDDLVEPNRNRHMKLEPTFELPLCDDPKSVMEKRSFAVVNSCNGFLCLCDPKDRDLLVVCNPITGEFIRLPEASTIVETKELRSAGFGFHSKTNEYKLMRIWHVIWEWMFGCMVVEMNTLGTSTWRNVGVDPMYSIGHTFPTCVNGALHWIGFDDNKGSILSFNFDFERFECFPSPPHVFEKDRIYVMDTITMGELRGSLYICDEPYRGLVKMWVMEKYGVGGSWVKVFNIDTDPRPYGFNQPFIKHFQLKKGSAILMYHSAGCFVYYEPRNKVFKILKLCNTYPNFEAIPHIPSLISLKDAMKGDNVEVLNVNSR